MDAVYSRPADRERIEETAVTASVPCVGLWLDAPEPVLVGRLQQRRLDPSDADADVIRQQLAQDVGTVGGLAWRESLHIEPRGAKATARHYIRDLVYGANDDECASTMIVPLMYQC